MYHRFTITALKAQPQHAEQDRGKNKRIVNNVPLALPSDAGISKMLVYSQARAADGPEICATILLLKSAAYPTPPD